MPTNPQHMQRLQELVSSAHNKIPKVRPHFDPWVEVWFVDEDAAWEVARILDRDELETDWDEDAQAFCHIVRIGLNTAEVYDLEDIHILILEKRDHHIRTGR